MIASVYVKEEGKIKKVTSLAISPHKIEITCNEIKNRGVIVGDKNHKTYYPSHSIYKVVFEKE